MYFVSERQALLIIFYKFQNRIDDFGKYDENNVNLQSRNNLKKLCILIGSRFFKSDVKDKLLADTIQRISKRNVESNPAKIYSTIQKKILKSNKRAMKHQNKSVLVATHLKDMNFTELLDNYKPGDGQIGIFNKDLKSSSYNRKYNLNFNL